MTPGVADQFWRPLGPRIRVGPEEVVIAAELQKMKGGLIWRRERDSNSRYLAVYALSKRAH